MKLSKKTVILSVIIILLPCLIGLLLWKRLPNTVPTHFDAHNQANGWSSKPFAVFGIPGLMAGLQLLCLWATTNDPRRKNINDKLFNVVIWIVPAVSLLCCLSSYALALNYRFNITLAVNLFIGVLFLIIGNYLPKAKQNYTVGIKLPWTLNSEENWNRTHRMSGWLWIAGGLLMIVNAFFGSTILFVITLCIITIPPTIYSYTLYKKGI